MTLGVSSEKLQESMDQLFSEILGEQKKVMGLKEADKGKENLIAEKLKEFEPYRGRGFYYNYLSSGRGHGPFTELVDGSVKYDLIGGIGINILGHSHPLFVKACLEAATVDTLMCGNLLSYQEPNELAQTMVNAVKNKSRLRHFWFAGSGSFANDVALKILWQKKEPRYNLLAFQNAFAGRSVATQDITYNQAYKEGMPTLVNVRHIPHFDQKDPENALKKSLKALDEAWEKEPDSFCAIMMELIQGEAGFVYGPREYYEGVFKWAKEKGLYIWIDEVQSFSRTHELFAFQMYGLDEYVDIVTVAKSLQCAGVLYTEELNPKPGLIAGTFNGSIPSLKAGKKLVKYMTEGGFFGENGKIHSLEQKFMKNFEKLSRGSCKGKIPYYGGVGTMLTFEVGDSSKETTTQFVKDLLKNGVCAFVAGKNPVRVRFLLPVCLTDEHINEVFNIIEKTVIETIK